MESNDPKVTLPLLFIVQNRFQALDPISRRCIPARYQAPRILGTASVEASGVVQTGQVSPLLEFEATTSTLLELFPEYTP